ncbi:MAG: hypothetical protein MUF18_02120 [Fimbriiglobus sp.]|nr:hypothetical protein [Fimbriiglobus sp.]
MPRPTLTLLTLAALPAAVLADAKNPTYDADVLPVLKQHCVSCHGPDKQRGGLKVDTYANLKLGGSSGEVVTPGNPDKSRLYTMTAHKEEPVMPPSKQKIPDAQIELLRVWIDQGGKENAGSKVVMPDKPKVDIGLKAVSKGKPDGPPPMPQAGKLKPDPLARTRRPGAVLALAASPWAPLVAVGGQRQILLYHADTGDFLGALPFEHGQINSLKFSRNSKLLLAAGGRGGASGKAVLFNVETCEKVTEVGIETDAILAADLSADQTMIAVGSPSKLVRIYSTADGKLLHEIKKHTDWVTAVEFSPDGVLLATADRNGGAFVWEAATAREFHTLRGHTAMITDLSWRADSNTLATASEDGTVKLWEMDNGTAFKSWAAHPGGAASVRYSRDGRVASTGRDKVTKVWDGNGGLQKQLEPFTDLGLKVAFTHDDQRVIAGDWGGTLKTWTPADAKVMAVADTNPLPVGERLKAAEAAFAAADAKLKQSQGAFNDANGKNAAAQKAFADANALVAKIAAELPQFQKAVTDQTNALNAAKAAVPPLKAEMDKLTAAGPMLTMTEQAKQVAAAALTKAAAEIQDAATKAPNNPMLAEQAKKAAEMVKAAQAELDAAKKANADHAAALKAATDKYTAAVKAQTELTTALAASQAKVMELTAAQPKATAAVAPAKAAAEAAAAAVAPAKAAAEAALAEFTRVKGVLDRLKPPPPPAQPVSTPAPPSATLPPATQIPPPSKK